MWNPWNILSLVLKPVCCHGSAVMPVCCHGYWAQSRKSKVWDQFHPIWGRAAELEASSAAANRMEFSFPHLNCVHVSLCSGSSRPHPEWRWGRSLRHLFCPSRLLHLHLDLTLTSMNHSHVLQRAAGLWPGAWKDLMSQLFVSVSSVNEESSSRHVWSLSELHRVTHPPTSVSLYRPESAAGHKHVVIRVCWFNFTTDWKRRWLWL